MQKNSGVQITNKSITARLRSGTGEKKPVPAAVTATVAPRGKADSTPKHQPLQVQQAKMQFQQQSQAQPQQQQQHQYGYLQRSSATPQRKQDSSATSRIDLKSAIVSLTQSQNMNNITTNPSLNYKSNVETTNSLIENKQIRSAHSQYLAVQRDSNGQLLTPNTSMKVNDIASADIMTVSNNNNKWSEKLIPTTPVALTTSVVPQIPNAVASPVVSSSGNLPSVGGVFVVQPQNNPTVSPSTPSKVSSFINQQQQQLQPQLRQLPLFTQQEAGTAEAQQSQKSPVSQSKIPSSTHSFQGPQQQQMSPSYSQRSFNRVLDQQRNTQPLFQDWDASQRLSNWEVKQVSPHKLIERITIESTNSTQFSKEPRSISRQSASRQRDFVSQIQTLPGGQTNRDLFEKSLTPEPRTIHPMNVVIQESYVQQVSLRERSKSSRNGSQQQGQMTPNSTRGSIISLTNQYASQSNLFSKALLSKKDDSSVATTTTNAASREVSYVTRYKEEYVLRTNGKDLRYQENLQKKRADEIEKRMTPSKTETSQFASSIARSATPRTFGSSQQNHQQQQYTRDNATASAASPFKFDSTSQQSRLTRNILNQFSKENAVAAGKVFEVKKNLKQQFSNSTSEVSSSNLGIYKSYEKAEQSGLVNGKKIHPMRLQLYSTTHNFLSGQP